MTEQPITLDPRHPEHTATLVPHPRFDNRYQVRCTCDRLTSERYEPICRAAARGRRHVAAKTGAAA
jgi:hypothetical protein